MAMTEEFRTKLENAFLKDFPVADREQAMGFVESTGLDPFRGQVKFLSRNAKNQRTNQWETRIVIVTGLDGHRARAAATGRYMADDQLPVVEYDDNGIPTRATVRVRVWDERTSQWSYIPASVRWSEYAERRTENKKVNGYNRKIPVGDGSKPEHYQSNWGKMPEVMLCKCAEVSALRRAFPDDLGGIYIEEEMGGVADSPVHENPFEAPSKYTCKRCKVEVTPAQASKTIREFDAHLCGKCEGEAKIKRDKDKPEEVKKATEPEPDPEPKKPEPPQEVVEPEDVPKDVKPVEPPKEQQELPKDPNVALDAQGTEAEARTISYIRGIVAEWKIKPRRAAFKNALSQQGIDLDSDELTADQIKQAHDMLDTWIGCHARKGGDQ